MTSAPKAISTLAIMLSFLFSWSALAQITDSSTVLLSKSLTFHSSILNENRTIRIQVPERMNQFDAYPVLYVLDGEAMSNMIGSQVQYLSESYKIIPSMIVVSIENTDRTRDLTPTHSIQGPDGKKDTSVHAFGYTSGGGEKFLLFIRQELMPYVESRYHTAPYKVLCGHSLGGLMSVYCLIAHPDYFNAFIAISPSLQWDNGIVLQQLIEKRKQQNNTPHFLFFSDANEDATFHQNQLSLDSILKEQGSPGLTYTRLFYPEESHISEPVKAFYDGIHFIYPDWSLPYNKSAFRATVTAKVVKDHFAALSKKYGYPVAAPHDEINQLSRFLRNDTTRINDAIELLEMNAKNYPASATVQEHLGDTWLKINNKDKALAAYRAALTLDPENEGIQKKIGGVSE